MLKASMLGGWGRGKHIVKQSVLVDLERFLMPYIYTYTQKLERCSITPNTTECFLVGIT